MELLATLVGEGVDLSMVSRTEEIKFQQKYGAQEFVSMTKYWDTMSMCHIRVAMMVLQLSQVQLAGILLSHFVFLEFQLPSCCRCSDSGRLSQCLVAV